jgi:HEAT repeat protein
VAQHPRERVDAGVRGDIAVALAELQDREALPNLRAILRDEQVNARVRDNIRDGLWKLAQAEKIPIRF